MCIFGSHCLNVYRTSPFSNRGYKRIRKIFCQFFVFDTDGTARRLGIFGNAGQGENDDIFPNLCKDEIRISTTVGMKLEKMPPEANRDVPLDGVSFSRLD